MQVSRADDGVSRSTNDRQLWGTGQGVTLLATIPVAQGEDEDIGEFDEDDFDDDFDDDFEDEIEDDEFDDDFDDDLDALDDEDDE